MKNNNETWVKHMTNKVTFYTADDLQKTLSNLRGINSPLISIGKSISEPVK